MITPKEFYFALQSKNKHDGMMVETNVKVICNTIRTSTRHLLNLSGKSLRKEITRDQDYMRFPWDGPNVIGKPQTKEEMKNVMRAIVAHHKNRKSKRKMKRTKT